MYKRKSAFTLIEVLISIAIIGLLIALLIPNIDRRLNKNQIANDAQLFSAKFEETHLLAGSTQVIDELGSAKTVDSDEAGYYAVALNAGQGDNYFSVVRLSYPIEDSSLPCAPATALQHAAAGSGACLVERIKFAPNTTYIGQSVEQLIAFRIPTQRFVRIIPSGSNYKEVAPTFLGTPVFRLTFQDKQANLYIDDYTGRVRSEFSTN